MSQIEELQEEQNAIRQREQEIDMLKLQFDEWTKSLDELDINTITNAELRKIVYRIEVYTNPSKVKNSKATDTKQV